MIIGFVRPVLCGQVIGAPVGLALTRGTSQRYRRSDSVPLLEGRVIAVERVGGASGKPTWLETVIERRGEAPFRVRIAPVEVLEAADFRIESGQTLQARVFSDEEPFVALSIPAVAQAQDLGKPSE